jgi:hypothetical protein
MGIDVAPLEVHHIVPLYRGGTNDAENLAALCKPCHKEAPDLDPGEEATFAAWIESVPDRMIVVGIKAEIPDPLAAARQFIAMNKACKKGLGQSPDELAEFEVYLGPDAEARRIADDDDPLGLADPDEVPAA